uniref:S-phase kinase-associated protein 2 n=1 Tax=Otolemur garnettii TaxID=30611 RepID=H0XS38_OTOGA
ETAQQKINFQYCQVKANFSWEGWDSSKTSKLLSGTRVSALEKEEEDSENILQELFSKLSNPQSSPWKQLKSKGSDEDFVVHRLKLNGENLPGVSWDSLLDEQLLGVFSCLGLPELLKISSVCKRWYRLGFDESLWQTLNLAGKNLNPDVIGWLLSQGVIAFHCRSFVDQPSVEHSRPFPLGHLGLSNSVMDVSILRHLSQCSKLQNLSLEGLWLSNPIVNHLSQNSILIRLNFSGCSGFPERTLKTLLSGLEELNLSGCYDFTEKHVQAAAPHCETITQLNLSSYRKNLQKVRRCPKLVHLDLSDSVMLKNDCFQEFYQLNYLQHLSLSRCDIIPETLLELGEIPTLKTLQNTFGIMPDGTLQLLREALPHLQINCSHLTTIARPTAGNKKNQKIAGIKCRLTLQKPSCL